MSVAVPPDEWIVVFPVYDAVRMPFSMVPLDPGALAEPVCEHFRRLLRRQHVECLPETVTRLVSICLTNSDFAQIAAGATDVLLGRVASLLEPCS